MFRTQALLAAVLLAMAGVLAGFSRETERARAAGRSPEHAAPEVERCVTCHSASREDPGGAHAAAALGCASCHLGNPLAFAKERAHEGLEREPGALDTVARTCGREGCHPREAARVASLPMTREDGIVAVDRFAFGEIAAPSGTTRTTEAGTSPAGLHVRKLCAGCHLGTRRANRDDAIAGNGSGCAACHVARRVGGAARRHPPIDARVPDERCFGCHSRSGRIALSYIGLAEVEPAQETPAAERVALPGGRVAVRVGPDVHQAAGMGCVDCHLHTEVMGDGTVRGHKEEAVEIRCETCHGPDAPEDAWGRVEEPVTVILLRLRGEARPPEEPVRLGSRGTPVWSVRGTRLFPKNGGGPLTIRPTPADANHQLRGHERLSCSACHASWAPTCTTCHTRFDPKTPQWDFAAGRETPGAWVERSEGFGWGKPALGVRADGRIVPAVPGMLLTLNARAAGGQESSRRLFAPLEPHTTGRRARTCESCHAEAQAFREGDEGTRPGFRPLAAARQARALAVGPCLRCHRTAADPVYRDFPRALSKRARACGRLADG